MMKSLVFFYALLLAATASAQSRQCYNLIKPLAGKSSTYPGAYLKIHGEQQTTVYKGIDFQKFTSKQPFDFQKMLAMSLWNYWVVLKNNELEYAALKKKWVIADKEFKMREPAAISGIFLDPKAEAINKIHIDSAKYLDTRAETAWRSVLRVLDFKANVNDVKFIDAKNPLSQFLDRSTATTDFEKVREFNNYIVEALLVEASPVAVYQFLTHRMQKNNFDFVTLRSPLCTKEDPVAEKTITPYYQRTITTPKYLATYLMTYTCGEKYRAPSAQSNCLIGFKKYLTSNDCTPYETPECRLDQETLKYVCASETLNCYNTYRTKDLSAVGRYDYAPKGFVVAADKLNNHYFCKLVK